MQKKTARKSIKKPIKNLTTKPTSPFTPHLNVHVNLSTPFGNSIEDSRCCCQQPLGTTHLLVLFGHHYLRNKRKGEDNKIKE